MAINLQKGQNVDLTKSNPGVSKYRVGLGWDEPTTVGYDFDADVSAFILGSDNKLVSENHLVFYNNLEDPNGFAKHSGDNRTGKGSGDDEFVILDMSKAGNAERIVFVVTIHDAQARGQNFGQVNNAHIRILNEETGEELMNYDLGEDYSIETAMVFGELYKRDGEFKFKAVGQGMAGGLQDFLNLYQ